MKNNIIIFLALVCIYFMHKYNYMPNINEFFTSFKKRYTFNLDDLNHSDIIEPPQANNENIKLDINNDNINNNIIVNSSGNIIDNSSDNIIDNSNILCNRYTDDNLDLNINRAEACLYNIKEKSIDDLNVNHAIPYNFNNKLDNNVLYNINPVYTSNKLEHEQQVSGDVIPHNQRTITNNFNKGIDSYKYNRRVDSILNIKQPNLNISFIKDQYNIPKNIKLFTRITENEIILNWNIPILPTGFYPENIIIAFSNKNRMKKNFILKNAEVFVINYSNTSCFVENDIFKIRSIKYDDRIAYTLTTDKKFWYNTIQKKYKLVSKIFFKFDINQDGKISKTFLESNISSL